MTDLFETITAVDNLACKSVQKRLAVQRSSAEVGTQVAATSDFSSSDEAPKTDIAVCNLNILTIDIGTTTGWALGLRDGSLHSGSQSFAPRRNDGPGQRWLKFAAWLGERARQAGEIHAVYYELVMAHGPRDNPNVLAAHAYGGFEAHLQAWADRNRIRLVGVAVATIKKSATGKGNAKKEAVMAAMRARGHRVIDDNHADALALLEYARKEEA